MNNLPDAFYRLDADGKYGWKHSTLSLSNPPDLNDLIIIVFRNISTWIPRIRKNTYENLPKSNLPIEQFLSHSWHSSEPHLETWENVFKMRTTKYQNWLNYTKLYPENSVWINYEALKKNSTEVLAGLVEKFNLRCKDVKFWDKVSCLSKGGKCVRSSKGRVFMANFHENEYKWERDMWDRVKENWDMELEAEIGYDYRSLLQRVLSKLNKYKNF